MKKAFLFDMDGVIVNSEVTWSKHGADFAPNLFGKDVYAKIGDTVGEVWIISIPLRKNKDLVWIWMSTTKSMTRKRQECMRFHQ